MRTAKSFIALLQIPRAFLHIWLFKRSPNKEIIRQDLKRWREETGQADPSTTPGWKALVWLLWKCQAFRNLFYYRIAKEERISSRVLLEIARLFFKPLDTLYIFTPEIGPGLFIQHGFSTIISAKRIGENCWINQQVTIGYSNNTDTPTIGDNVAITAGAKVFGGITIGDNSIIGANAVVFKDVPPNCTVVGVPGMIVKRDGIRVNLPL